MYRDLFPLPLFVARRVTPRNTGTEDRRNPADINDYARFTGIGFRLDEIEP